MLAEISLCNRLTASLLRARADKFSLAQPPDEVPPNTTLAWQVEDAGSVTYDLTPEEGGERGVVKRFTLHWSLAPDGAVHCLVHDAARSLRVDIEQRPDGVLCTVTSRRRRVPPPPRHSRLLTRLLPVTAGIVVVALLGATLTALGSPFGGHRGATPTAGRIAIASATATHAPTVTVAPHKPTTPTQVSSGGGGNTSGSSSGTSGGSSSGSTSSGGPPPKMSVSPTGTTAVNCFGASVGYPAITVSNTGGQTLSWSATSSNGAASVSPDAGALSPGGSQQLHVSQAGPTSTATNMSISSNGGNATVSFTCIPASAQLKVTQNQNASETCSGPVAPPYTVILDNTASNISVGWQFDAASYSSWASATPASGTVPVGQTASLQVIPNTCAAAGQTHTYQATLHLSFPQGGSEPDIALMDATTGPPTPPQLTVNYTQITIGGACGPTGTVTLGNTGQQTLTWSATTTNGYTVSPTNGSIAGEQTMNITIGGMPIDYTQPGYVYITSNGGNATISVNYSCPY
jgi:hypothetical protein